MNFVGFLRVSLSGRFFDVARTTADHMLLQRYSVRRGGRIVMYLGLLVSGVFAVIDPAQLVREQVSTFFAHFWAGGMILSALICLYGAVTDRWIGEYTGIPLLAAVLGLYGVSALLSVSEDGIVVLAAGLVILSFTAGLIARWRDLQEIKANAFCEEEYEKKGS